MRRGGGRLRDQILRRSSGGRWVKRGKVVGCDAGGGVVCEGMMFGWEVLKG